MADDRRPFSGGVPPDSPIGAALASLREILEGTNTRDDLSQATGIPAGTLKDYFTGRSVPTLDRFLKIIEAVGISPEAFFRQPIATSEEAIVHIPVLDVEAAAGSGRVQDVISAVEQLPFPRKLLERLAPADAWLSCLRCSGNSMEPTIKDGALIIIDEHQKKLPEPRASTRKSPKPRQQLDDIYVFFHSEDIRMKRLRKLEEGFVAIYSDNHAEHPIEIFRAGREGALVIVGKVIWWDNRL